MSVRAWEEQVVIPTYAVPPPDRNPMFLEKRVYQGSSGKVYPCAFTDRVSDEKTDRAYRAVFLENEHIRVMILPELGGRIHIGQDKSNGYDFFYRQTVIKPALVGLLGPWISGGVEFNWPQHHRPTTFMPVEHTIEEHADGSRTVWLSEHEPMNRMKGMVGICLYPGKAFVEAKGQIYNRTAFMQTFLWWANAGVHVHEDYEAFFPPDVTFVADHARRAMTEFPLARGRYYGVDYAPGVDLRWYKNIPVPTSYMVTKSEYDFVGGYDHRRRAGVVHYADRHIAPGKKLWTWGNSEFGRAWDRELTDSDGPYVELMAGVFTDNQPDFSWLHPYETRTFRQYWYPIREIGPVKNANREAAVNLEVRGGEARVGICVTAEIAGATVSLAAGPRAILQERVDLRMNAPFSAAAKLPEGFVESDLLLTLRAADGRTVISYAPPRPDASGVPAPASEPTAPAEIASNDRLYLAGVHLEQYRHATRMPEPYWEEALRRDPGDWRCQNALGVSDLRRGCFAAAERHFQAAVETLTRWNQNPRDGEAHYNLGVAAQYRGRLAAAYDAYQKAAWSHGWQSAAQFALARIEWLRGRSEAALQHLDRALTADGLHTKARNLKTAILRKAGRRDVARELAHETISLDPLDAWARSELALLDGGPLPELPEQTALDVAFDYAAAGVWQDAVAQVERFPNSPASLYPLGYFLVQAGEAERAREAYVRAAAAPSDYYFPSRIEEMIVLEQAPADARAPYYLGNLLYDKKRYDEAIRNWETAAERDPAFPTAWRNLGIAYYNVRRESERALAAYARALAADPADARVLYECDQLRERTGAQPRTRLALLERSPELVARRDDLAIAAIALYNQTGQHQRALEALAARRFHPWEGGEGKASSEYVTAHMSLGRGALESGDAAAALAHFESVLLYPENLGEGKHPLTPENHIHYFRGLALEAMRRGAHAEGAFRVAAAEPPAISEMSCYQALALRKLGDAEAAQMTIRDVREYVAEKMSSGTKIDFFATSLPNFLLFDDDLELRNRIECAYLLGMAELAGGNSVAAEEQFQRVLAMEPRHFAAQQELAAARKGAHYAGV